MKIVKLTSENVKRLKAIEIIPEGNTVVISGKNGQGKSSILDSIWFALGGGDATKDTLKPIREGEDKASVTLDLGELKVTRKWSSSGTSTLKVENAEGAVFKSPQSMLDGLIGKLSFDPLAFSRMDNKTQLATLMSLVKLPVDPAELDAKKKAVFDERTVVNRQIKQLEGQLAGMPPLVGDTPTEEVSSQDIMDEYQKAFEETTNNNIKRADLQKLRDGCRRINDEIKNVEDSIKRLQDDLKTLQESAEETKKEGKVLSEEVSSLVDPDLPAIKAKLNDVEVINKAVRANNAREATVAQLLEVTKVADTLTNQLFDIDKQKNDMMIAAQFPIEELAFDETGVTYKGLPFKQASSAEQLRVSLAMAMSLNPKLRVIRITDGSLLDESNMKLIGEMAKEKDFQVWIESVNESGEVGLYIEDGEVKVDNYHKAS